MHVTFKIPQKLGNKPFKAGAQMVPDHLARNIRFKELVKSGHIVIHPKDSGAQEVQASKDAQNANKSEVARRLTKKLSEAKDLGAKPAEVAAQVKGMEKLVSRSMKPIPKAVMPDPVPMEAVPAAPKAKAKA